MEQGTILSSPYTGEFPVLGWKASELGGRGMNRRQKPTSEKHPPGEHLSQDAASCPHVDGFGVVVGRQEQTGGAVPLGHQAFREVTLEEQRETGVREGREQRLPF